MVAAEESQDAFGGNLSFEHPSVTAFFIDVVGVSDNLAGARQPNQSTVSITNRTVDVHIAAQNAGKHPVGVALTKSHGTSIECDRYMSLDQLVDQFRRQIE